jgi:hypothetical protein
MSRSKQLYLFNQVNPDIPSNYKPIQLKLFTAIEDTQIFIEICVICFVPISRCWDGALRDTEHVPFLCRLASPKRARNLTMLWF